jgi:3-oxoacyl-[acyl-carrier protein] reductase
MNPAGKVALVTGGGTGIGRATALLLAAKGADVVVNYSRSKAEAEATAAEIRALGRKALAVRADVADNAQVVAMIVQTVRDLGHLDILINNAAWTAFVDFRDMDGLTDEIWDRTMAVNLKGPFFCSRAAAPHMEKAGGGVIINVSSMAGVLGRGNSIPYCASKAALNLLTRILAKQLAPAIRVNAVAPGVVTTRWTKEQKAFVRGAELQTPMKRVATPEDVAGAILSLIEGTDFITGQLLAVDGGLGA